MASNNFKAFGIGAGANVTAQTDYEKLSALSTGFVSGKANSAQVNKALRQSTVMSSVLAQFISNTNNQDVLDNGDTTTLLANLITALKVYSAGGLIGAPKVYAASGAYTPTVGVRMIRVTVTGGGGSGSGCLGTSGSQQISGSGGGAAGTAIKTMTITPGTTYSVIVGSGGASVTGSVSGNSGGSSSFNSSIIGGGGGLGGVTGLNASGGTPGYGSGGDINIGGGNGSDGQSGATFIFAGNGGASYWGGGGRAGAGSGGQGYAYGSGGGGAYTTARTAAPSGAGKSGIVVIEEFS